MSTEFSEFFGSDGHKQMKDIREIFGDRMKEIRLGKGVSQEALAAAEVLVAVAVVVVEDNLLCQLSIKNH